MAGAPMAHTLRPLVDRYYWEVLCLYYYVDTYNVPMVDTTGCYVYAESAQVPTIWPCDGVQCTQNMTMYSSARLAHQFTPVSYKTLTKHVSEQRRSETSCNSNIFCIHYAKILIEANTIAWWLPNSKQRVPICVCPKYIYWSNVLLVAFCHIAHWLSSDLVVDFRHILWLTFLILVVAFRHIVGCLWSTDEQESASSERQCCRPPQAPPQWSLQSPGVRFGGNCKPRKSWVW